MFCVSYIIQASPWATIRPDAYPQPRCTIQDYAMNPDTLLKFKLPEDKVFEDLGLRRCDDAAIDLDMDLVQQICQLNGLDWDKVRLNPGPVVSTILSVWYKSHLAEGGSPDPVMEQLKRGH